MTDIQLLIIIGMMALGTAATRYLAFLLFPDSKETSPYILYLGRALPYAVIGLLVVYCLKSVSVTSFPFGLPELIAIVSVVLLHIWKKNTLLSIGVGTVVYMFLIQRVF